MLMIDVGGVGGPADGADSPLLRQEGSNAVVVGAVALP